MRQSAVRHMGGVACSMLARAAQVEETLAAGADVPVLHPVNTGTAAARGAWATMNATLVASGGYRAERVPPAG